MKFNMKKSVNLHVVWMHGNNYDLYLISTEFANEIHLNVFEYIIHNRNQEYDYN